LTPGVVFIALQHLASGVGHGYHAAQVVLVQVAGVGGAVAAERSVATKKARF
jgi:hypothetical protein